MSIEEASVSSQTHSEEEGSDKIKSEPPLVDHKRHTHSSRTGIDKKYKITQKSEVRFKVLRRHPSESFLDRIHISPTTANETICWCHMTCCLVVWIFHDILFSLIEMTWYMILVYIFKNHDADLKFVAWATVAGGGEALFSLTTLIGLYGLLFESPVGLFIYIIRCINKILFDLSITFWAIAIFSKRGGKLDAVLDYRLEPYLVFVTIATFIYSLFWFYGAYISHKCSKMDCCFRYFEDCSTRKNTDFDY